VEELRGQQIGGVYAHLAGQELWKSRSKSLHVNDSDVSNDATLIWFVLMTTAN